MLNNMDSTAKTSNILDEWDLKQSQLSSLFSWKQSRGFKLAPGLWLPGPLMSVMAAIWAEGERSAL